MAATGEELVKLSQLKLVKTALDGVDATKVNKPTGGNGTSGQFLVTNGDGTTQWKTHEIGTGSITTDMIANDAVTADKIADGVIPDAVSDLTNDLQFQTQTQVQQTVNQAVQTAVSAVYKYKGSVANEGALPSDPKPATGDVYNVEDTGMNYA